MVRRLAGFAACWGLLALSASAHAAPPVAVRPRIVFFSPNSEHNTYWPQVFRIVEQVARDLNFDFVPYSLGVEDRFARRDATLRILYTEPRPQAVIVSVVIGHTQPILAAAEALGIPVFILGPLFPTELPSVGRTPRNKYAHWTALLNWAEEKKGHALGKALLEAADAAGARAADGSLQVVGLGGDSSWFGSGLRQAGLMRAVAEHPGAVLKQVVPTKWTRDEATRLTLRLLQRFPEASVVWTASDQLGAGAADALVQLGKRPGRDVFTGGLDLSDLGLQRVKDGSFVCTVASTLLSYAEAAVLLYDYVHGIDFATELGTTLEFPTQMATRDNVDQFLQLSKCVDAIDFKTFSKVFNQDLHHYRFSLEAYLDAAGGCVHP